MRRKTKVLRSRIAISLIVISLVLLFTQRDKLNCILTRFQLQHANIELTQSDSLLFMKQFDNTNKKRKFKLSLIEIGANGCIPCRKMDTVLLEINKVYGDHVNIQFFNVTKEKGKKASKYFNINVIPAQIILNSRGGEVFRNIGFYSTEELQMEINKVIDKNTYLK